MLVSENYEDCFTYEESTLAHYIFHLLSEKKISLEDDASKIDIDQADHRKVAELIQTNFLGIHPMGIYSLKLDQKTFVFIFARNEQEAIEFYTETFQQPPLNCHEYLLDFQIVRGKAVISFRDLKKDFGTFPAIAGYFIRE
jgi:hypothetical protein